MSVKLIKSTFLGAIVFVVVLVSFVNPSLADAQTIKRSAACPNIDIIDFPRDYRRREEFIWKHKDMDKNHFQPALRQIKSSGGKGIGGTASGNLHWMLARVPNHHQALQALIQYSFIIKKKPRHKPLYNAPECYLQQAMYWAPDDPMIPFLFGLYLHRLGQYEKAVELYQAGLKLVPNSAEGNYNLGLSLFKLKRYDEALKHAQLAYEYGHPLQGLARMLARKGYKLVPDKNQGS